MKSRNLFMYGAPPLSIIIMGMKNMKRIENHVDLTSRLEEILTIVTGNQVPFLVMLNRRGSA